MIALPMLARPSRRSVEEARRRSVVLRVAVVLAKSRSRSAQIFDRDLLPLADAGVVQLEGVGCGDDVVQHASPISVRGDAAHGHESVGNSSDSSTTSTSSATSGPRSVDPNGLGIDADVVSVDAGWPTEIDGARARQERRREYHMLII